MRIIVNCLYGEFTSKIVPREQMNGFVDQIKHVTHNGGSLSFDTPDNETIYFNSEILKNAIIRIRY